MDHKMSRSPWVIHYDGSSCNGCDIEVLASLTPLFDAERFGVVNTGNPKHADIFLVTGSVNAQNLPVVRQIYVDLGAAPMDNTMYGLLHTHYFQRSQLSAHH